MAYSLELLPKARLDLLDACDWYDSQEENLGAELALQLDTAFIQITSHPSHYSFYSDKVRHYSLRKFPYCIYYITRNARVIIVAILHQKQDERNILHHRKL